LFAAAVSDGAATAAIVALAFTIGSWVLDFALAGQPGLLTHFIIGHQYGRTNPISTLRSKTYVFAYPCGSEIPKRSPSS
jgi:hypothetical protein